VHEIESSRVREARHHARYNSSLRVEGCNECHTCIYLKIRMCRRAAACKCVARLQTVGELFNLFNLLQHRGLAGSANGALALDAHRVVPHLHDVLLEPRVNRLQLLQRESVDRYLLLFGEPDARPADVVRLAERDTLSH
jgi:hypothetical protein